MRVLPSFRKYTTSMQLLLSKIVRYMRYDVTLSLQILQCDDVILCQVWQETRHSSQRSLWLQCLLHFHGFRVGCHGRRGGQRFCETGSSNLTTRSMLWGVSFVLGILVNFNGRFSKLMCFAGNCTAAKHASQRNDRDGGRERVLGGGSRGFPSQQDAAQDERRVPVATRLLSLVVGPAVVV